MAASGAGSSAVAASDRWHTLVVVGPGDILDACASARSFAQLRLPAAAGPEAVADAVAIRGPDGDLDRTHVVALWLHADGDASVRTPHSAEPSTCGAPGSGSDRPPSPDTPPTATTAPRVQHMLALARAARAAAPHAFILLWHSAAVEDPRLRIAAFAAGASMVTCFTPHAEEALKRLASIRAALPEAPANGAAHARAPADPGQQQQQQQQQQGQSAQHLGSNCTCPWCGQTGLSANDLWLHQPLHHVYERNRSGTCSACGEAVENLAVHIHEEHYPGGPHREERRPLGSGVVVHRPRDNKFLMVQEFADQGFWVPGGATDEGETLSVTAVRECLEEAGVEVELVGLAEVAHTLCPKTGKPTWRLAVFYAVVKDEAAAMPKTLPCFESAGACWVSVEELQHIPLRSPRIPITWYPHFADGARPGPLALPDHLKHMFPDVKF